MHSHIQDVRDAASRAYQAQSKWKERKDTLAGLVVLATFVASTIQAVDWSDLTSWAPVVGSWVVAVIGVIIHRFTEGAITPRGVERIVEQAEYIGRHRAAE